MSRKQFGARPSSQDLGRYKKSPNWKDSKFLNLEHTSMAVSFQTLPKMLYKQFCEKQGREPKMPLQVEPFDSKAFLAPSEETKFMWYGHSVILMRLAGKTVLIDPMFGPNAAPISPFPVKRFSENTLNILDDFPKIDLLFLSHDHYDHLDYESMMRLKKKVKRFYVALGLARHLVAWGIPKDIIVEFDWWDNRKEGEIEIIFTPSRHFSGRGLIDRAKSLWGGWVLKKVGETIWFSGDGGYGSHFKTIGERLGPFDLAFMECGQYNENWHQIHMYPEESIQAAIDAKAKCIMPVHWGAFALAQHSWKDPVERFIKEAKNKNVSHIIPRLGQPVNYKNFNIEVWW